MPKDSQAQAKANRQKQYYRTQRTTADSRAAEGDSRAQAQQSQIYGKLGRPVPEHTNPEVINEAGLGGVAMAMAPEVGGAEIVGGLVQTLVRAGFPGAAKVVMAEARMKAQQGQQGGMPGAPQPGGMPGGQPGGMPGRPMPGGPQQMGPGGPQVAPGAAPGGMPGAMPNPTLQGLTARLQEAGAGLVERAKTILPKAERSAKKSTTTAPRAAPKDARDRGTSYEARTTGAKPAPTRTVKAKSASAPKATTETGVARNVSKRAQGGDVKAGARNPTLKAPAHPANSKAPKTPMKGGGAANKIGNKAKAAETKVTSSKASGAAKARMNASQKGTSVQNKGGLKKVQAGGTTAKGAPKVSAPQHGRIVEKRSISSRRQAIKDSNRKAGARAVLSKSPSSISQRSPKPRIRAKRKK